MSIVGNMAKRQTAEEKRAAAEQAEIDRLDALEIEAEERRKEAEAADQRIIDASHKTLLKEKCGNHKLYLSKHPDREAKIEIAVQPHPRKGCEVWAKVDSEKGKLCWQGFKSTTVAIQNDAGDIVGWLESA